MVAVLFMALFQAVGVLSVLPFIDVIMAPEAIHDNRWLSWFYEFFNFASINQFIIFLGFGILGLIVIGNLTSAYAIWLQHRFAWRKNHNLASSLLRKYLSLPYMFFLDHHTSDLSKNILSEVNELTRGFMLPLVKIVTKGIVAAFIFIMIFVVDPGVSLLAILVLGGSYALIYMNLRRKLNTAGKRRVKENKRRFTAAGEALGGIKDTKVLGREGYFLQRFMVHSEKFADLKAWNEVVGKVPKFILEIVAFGGVMLLILTMLMTGGEVGEIIPTISFFAFAGYRLMPALQEMFQSVTKLQFNKAALNNIYDNLMIEGSSNVSFRSGKELPEPLPFESVIELNNMSFSYPNTSEHVLKNINLAIEHNTSVAFAGPTGSGKTTLVDIILGLLTPTEGEMKVDGTKIDDSNVRNWQRNLGYVPQQIYLSDDTVARNIAFGLGDDEIDMEEVQRAAKMANLHDFIVEEMPRGYNTVVGERGVRLSGGQRQRLGIARALYHDPEVLVLDEATSALDGVTEQAVFQAIEEVSKQKTLIIIAHRLATVKNCDVIYLLEKGEIVAEGSYDNLISSSRYFRRMAEGV